MKWHDMTVKLYGRGGYSKTCIRISRWYRDCFSPVVCFASPRASSKTRDVLWRSSEGCKRPRKTCHKWGRNCRGCSWYLLPSLEVFLQAEQEHNIPFLQPFSCFNKDHDWSTPSLQKSTHGACVKVVLAWQWSCHSCCCSLFGEGGEKCRRNEKGARLPYQVTPQMNPPTTGGCLKQAKAASEKSKSKYTWQSIWAMKQPQ